MTSRTPTAEQAAIIDAFKTGQDLVVEARAGTGKTTTLKMLAEAQPRRRGLYLAYNRAIADDAKKTFPAPVKCSTAHGLAYGAVVTPAIRTRLNGPRVPARQVCRILRINEPLRVEDKVLAPEQIARLVMAAVGRFANSADPEPQPWHVPTKPGLDSDAAKAVIREAVTPLARKAWADLTSADGQLKFEHGHYLKCQPAGTMVRLAGGREIPIESIKTGMKVMTWRHKSRLGIIRKTGRPVTQAASRNYSGQLVTVATASGKSSTYTHDHICIAMVGDSLDGKTIVYLMRRGSDYRIGRTPWRYGSQDNTLGIVTRARTQSADAVWVLSAHDTDRDAALAEALAQHAYGIPGWQFHSANEFMPLDEFWAKAGGNERQAAECLTAHGRDILYPLWVRGGQRQWNRNAVQIRASNLMDGMRVCEVDQIEPTKLGVLFCGGWTNAWQPVAVTRTPYDGEVYSIEVDVDHSYIADGIVTHNCWQLSRPVLRFDYVMLDESQDANPVIASVVDGQHGTQKCLVGDASQAIYGWNGAIDAMSKFRADQRVALSQSFRFGPQIAAEANKWLQVLGSLPLVTGFERVNSVVTETGGDVDAVLCRTNAQAVAELIAAHTSGRKAALVGGGAEVKRLAQAAITLKAGLGCDHPELFAFRTWGEVQDYAADDPGGSDLKVFVKLIDDHGPDEVIGIIENLSQERYADVVVSTAHKAKGREWNSVRIAGDFHEPKKDKDGELGEISREDAMLAYVAVTRAKQVLDRSGLAWVDGYLPGAGDEDGGPES